MFVNVFATNKYLKIHLHWKTHLFGKEHASAIGSTTKIRRVLLENPTLSIVLFIQKNCSSIIYLRLFTDQSSPLHHVSTSQQRAEALNGASMYICLCVMANFLIFVCVCGHIKKISHHYCVNIWTHIEKKVLTLELSSESTLTDRKSTRLNSSH